MTKKRREDITGAKIVWTHTFVNLEISLESKALIANKLSELIVDFVNFFLNFYIPLPKFKLKVRAFLLAASLQSFPVEA